MAMFSCIGMIFVGVLRGATLSNMCNPLNSPVVVLKASRSTYCHPLSISAIFAGIIPRSGELQQLWWVLEKGGVGGPRITVEGFRSLLQGNETNSLFAFLP